jgi:hypothetical protein
VSADALADEPGNISGRNVQKVKAALETAKENVDAMEDAED